MNATGWDENTTERERFALLAALEDYRQRTGLTVPSSAYSFDHEEQRWIMQGEERRGPIVVAVHADASAQADRLRKLGIPLREAMALIGYGMVDDSGDVDHELAAWEGEGGAP